jgi:hypothetical protein
MDTDRLHWMAVGDITEHAKLGIKNVGGFVRKVDAAPLPLYLVGIPCKTLPDSLKETDVKITTWKNKETTIDIPSAQLTLLWSSTTRLPPTNASVHNTTLDIWQET